MGVDVGWVCCGVVLELKSNDRVRYCTEASYEVVLNRWLQGSNVVHLSAAIRAKTYRFLIRTMCFW